MAGEWIKMETCLIDKPEVFQLSEILGMDSFSIVGRLHVLWSWADRHTLSGNGISVTNVTIDKITNCTGFADALRKVCWLEGRDGLLSFPNFERHNGQTAKNRALTNDRVSRLRNARSVTESLPEKRREDSTVHSHTPHARPKSIDEAIQFGFEKGFQDALVRHWFSQRDSQGWVKANGMSITNWRPDLETWALSQRHMRPQQRQEKPGSGEIIKAKVIKIP